MFRLKPHHGIQHPESITRDLPPKYTLPILMIFVVFFVYLVIRMVSRTIVMWNRLGSRWPMPRARRDVEAPATRTPLSLPTTGASSSFSPGMGNCSGFPHDDVHLHPTQYTPRHLSHHFDRNGVLQTPTSNLSTPAWERRLNDGVRHGQGFNGMVDRVVDKGTRWIMEKATENQGTVLPTQRSAMQEGVILGSVSGSAVYERRKARTVAQTQASKKP